ncbi:MAG TPA: sigma-70 family RNA polymerase sigma factor [Sedimentisphaerales bacterium]|jgi:RNA polymerase sigma-70 factor (ECF subfamily)|nr:sigma-70 family RNA polymerase sigma factor [Sedimentisphaerales bacterium]HNU28024.1 sigma-70 family RNA polymerase sigma factor [Sedimentisphaerales bacterium]
MLGSEDRLLLRQLGRGSRHALCRIYEKYRRELFTIAVSLGGDRDLAEDCLQDVFVHLAESGGRIRVGKNLKGYLASSMINRARDQIRRQARRIGCSVEDLGCCAIEPGPVQRLAEDEQAAALLVALGRLPREQREVFVLHTQAGLAFREIARIQETPLRTAHSRYRYAIEKLRELLGEENES